MPELFESAADTVRWKNTIICHPSVQFSVTYIRLIRQTMLHCQKTNCSLFRQGLSPVSSSLPRGDALLNFKLSDAAIFPEMQVAILDTISRRGSRIFGHGGPAEFWPQEGALSPKFAQNRGFPLKLPENCMILNKSLGARAPPPGIHWFVLLLVYTLCSVTRSNCNFFAKNADLGPNKTRMLGSIVRLASPTARRRTSSERADVNCHEYLKHPCRSSKKATKKNWGVYWDENKWEKKRETVMRVAQKSCFLGGGGVSADRQTTRPRSDNASSPLQRPHQKQKISACTSCEQLVTNWTYLRESKWQILVNSLRDLSRHICRFKALAAFVEGEAVWVATMSFYFAGFEKGAK